MTRTTHLLRLVGSLWLAAASASQVYDIPAAVSNRTTTALFTSSSSGLDAPKINPVNNSAFDWWYFDVVSTDPNSVASVVVQISGSFPNGTPFNMFVNGDGATVTADDNVSSGDWHGTGFKWIHTGNATYTIQVDAPDIGVKGTISFHSIAPAHYPCGPMVVGQNMEVGPRIGWANAIPDAASTVELTVNGTELAFTGAGYHDKNWSDQIFTTNITSWYWGHGRLGPYSIVWFDFLALDGTEYVSAYAAKYGTIIAASCESNSIRVRPTGQNATYPPHLSTPPPSGYHVTLDLENEGTLEVDVTVTEIVMDISEYTRSVGNMSGVVVPVGGQNERTVMGGKALFEQFKLTE
ncbi:hypothetical protein MVEN_02302600 [Mycena venus]|uniref:Hydroxyneurosporene synthase n=1 Tax=Mycena venus TaxID=2733690 RepID=A0A8H7CEK3_9AGAR|nr:hypothetical protein MVEN_02302600 [Mycena venus]